jgi:outer membrane protein assembly factor BamB
MIDGPNARLTRRATLVALGGLSAGCTFSQRRLADGGRATDDVDRDDANWEMFGGGPENRGYVPGAVSGNPERSWESPVAIEEGDILSVPLVGDGTVYIGGWTAVYAVDLDDGSEQWAHDVAQNAGFVSPALSDDAMIVGQRGTDGQRLAALRRSDGEEEWHRDIWANSGLTVADGAVYLHGSDGDAQGIYALRANDGGTDWRVNVEWDSSLSVVGTVAVGSDVVCAIAPGENGSHETNAVLWGLDPDDGSRRWEYDGLVELQSDPTIVDGTVYVGTANGLAAIDAETGEEQWVFETPGAIRTSPATDGEEIYVVDMDKTLRAIGLEDQTERWSQGIGMYVDWFRTHPVLTDDYVFLGGDELTAFDKGGTERWRLDVASYSSAYTAPAVAADTVVAASCQKEEREQNYDNFLYALR